MQTTRLSVRFVSLHLRSSYGVYTVVSSDGFSWLVTAVGPRTGRLVNHWTVCLAMPSSLQVVTWGTGLAADAGT